MNLGTAIWCAAILLSGVAMFIATRDSWNWKKISKWICVIGCGVPALVGSALLGYSWLADRPHAATGFGGIQIGAPEADVRFLKGEPRLLKEDLWQYPSGSLGATYNIMIKNGKVCRIMYAAEYDEYPPELQGIARGATYEQIVKRFGRPSEVSADSTQLSRMMSYKEYNLFFVLKKNELWAYGVFDPAYAPPRYSGDAGDGAALKTD